MTGKYSSANNTVQAIVALLPDDPLAATSEVLTAAALVAISAGLDDARAVNGLKASLQKWRELGVGEERH